MRYSVAKHFSGQIHTRRWPTQQGRTLYRRLGGLLAATLIALVACSSADPPTIRITATPATDPRPAAVAARLPEVADDDETVNPLTGLPVEPSALWRRPLAVKISNGPDTVRPQAGIAEADLVFEHYTEGQITRFTAIYWAHTPPRVGSVRSARLIDLELPAMYGALLAYAGASEPIRQQIAELPFAPRAYEGVTTGPPLYFRDPGIAAPHNLFAIPAEIWARAKEDGINEPPDLRGMWFDETLPAEDDSSPAEQVTIDYGADVVRWDYDAATGLYARRVDGEPHTDATTSEQVTAANVVLLYAHHQENQTIPESTWQGVTYYSIEIQLWTLGPAVICRDGRTVEGYWMRWEEDALLTFWADEDAAEMLALKPGNTWFEVVPLDFTAATVE